RLLVTTGRRIDGRVAKKRHDQVSAARAVVCTAKRKMTSIDVNPITLPLHSPRRVSRNQDAQWRTVLTGNLHASRAQLAAPRTRRRPSGINTKPSTHTGYSLHRRAQDVPQGLRINRKLLNYTNRDLHHRAQDDVHPALTPNHRLTQATAYTTERKMFHNASVLTADSRTTRIVTCTAEHKTTSINGNQRTIDSH